MSSPEARLHATELGPMLFKRRQNAMAVIGIVMGLIFGGIGLAALVGGIDGRNHDDLTAGAVLMGVAATIALVVAVRSGTVLRCYELGVSKEGWLGRRALRFDQLAAVTFSATKMRVEGIPVGTTFRIRLEPDAGAGVRPIAFSGNLRKNDTQIETLRELASEAVARRMGRELIANGHVAWTRRLGLVAEGIEHRPLGFFRRKSPTVLPFDQIARFDIKDGVFSVWRVGRKPAVLRASVSEPNFFPGHRLLVMLLEQKRRLVVAPCQRAAAGAGLRLNRSNGS